MAFVSENGIWLSGSLNERKCEYGKSGGGGVDGGERMKEERGGVEEQYPRSSSFSDTNTHEGTVTRTAGLCF